jgi:hypothetical protein
VAAVDQHCDAVRGREAQLRPDLVWVCVGGGFWGDEGGGTVDQDWFWGAERGKWVCLQPPQTDRYLAPHLLWRLDGAPHDQRHILDGLWGGLGGMMSHL